MIMMNRLLTFIIAAGTGCLYYACGSGSGESDIMVPVKSGSFEVTVTTTGELNAKNTEDIKGPSGLRQAGIYNVKISDLILEGTVVKEGDYIASLDRTEISSKLQDAATELQKIESQFTQIRLDTSLDLRQARDNLVNLKYAMEEAKITLEHSKFEPPATIRQAEIESDKAIRAFEQSSENYTLKEKQARAKMQEITATLSKQQAKYSEMTKLIDQFTIKAPKGGMVIYIRDWNGKKKTVGSEISAWDPEVATLPDLSVMHSRTYINEVDIRKIKVDQKVKVGVDAFPGKSFSGKVVEVANIGEQRPNSDAKVFEVLIEIEGTDTLLRPAMTTSNSIITFTGVKALFIPVEALHSADSVPFVYREKGFSIVRQEVVPGISNETDVIIEAGLEEGDMVFLNVPEEGDKARLVRLKKR